MQNSKDTEGPRRAPDDTHAYADVMSTEQDVDRVTRSGDPVTPHWFVYLLRCADGTLYAGITTNLDRRIAEHNTGKAGARYTRARRPVLLAWQQQVTDRSAASRCEYLLRTLSKVEKEALITAGTTLTNANPAVANAIQEPPLPVGGSVAG